MGEKDKQEIGQTNTGAGAGNPHGGSSSSAYPKRKTTPPRRTGSGEKTNKEKTEIPVKEVLVLSPDNENKNPTTPDTEPPKTVSVNTYDASVNEPVLPTTEKTPKKRTRKKTTKMDMTQFDALLIGLSDYIASRPNCAHWKMTQKEVQSITEPLGNILAKSDYMTQISEHSDAIALVLACGTIFIPRIIITVNMEKEKKPKKIPVQVKKNEQNRTDRSSPDTTGTGAKTTRNDSKIDSTNLRKGTSETTANASSQLGDLAIGMF